MRVTIVQNLFCFDHAISVILTTKYFFQSIINRLNFCTANIPGKAKLSGKTAKSMSDNEIHKTVRDVNGPSGVLVTMGEQPSKRDESLDASRKLQ